MNMSAAYRSARLALSTALKGPVSRRELRAALTHNTPDYTMVGVRGLTNIEQILEAVKRDGVDGDFVETGIWRGGACMYARAVMNELGMRSKTVFACDSFKGVPPPDAARYPADRGDRHYVKEAISVPKSEVMDNFRRFRLSDGVVFVEGWFRDTMPALGKSIRSIAVLRVDGDLYESTMVVLDSLYDKVAKGGFVILDDYCLERSRRAADDFRRARGIRAELRNYHGVRFWRKE